VQQMMGAVGLTLASPVSSPTFLAPNSFTSWKNFSVTSAFSGAVYHADARQGPAAADGGVN